MSADPRRDRALGALLGGALGDALGMPTQTLSRAEIQATYGVIEDFVAPHAEHPVSHGLPAGAITDDTEQSVLLARRLIAGGGTFDERAWVADLLAWERDVAARGLRDLLGPSTKRALADILAGIPAERAGRFGDTNGAAMRIAPVAIATPMRPLAHLVDRVEETCRVTHNTGLAIAAAAAVAAAISAGIDGAAWREAIDFAGDAARLGQTRGYDPHGPDIAGRIALACGLAADHQPAVALERIAAEIGTGVAAQESVPAAFGILILAEGDAWQAGLIGAAIGDDTDTIAAIAGAIAGACSGAAALPADKVETVCRVNRLDLGPTVDGLLALRDRAGTAAEAQA